MKRDLKNQETLANKNSRKRSDAPVSYEQLVQGFHPEESAFLMDLLHSIIEADLAAEPELETEEPLFVVKEGTHADTFNYPSEVFARYLVRTERASSTHSTPCTFRYVFTG